MTVRLMFIRLKITAQFADWGGYFFDLYTEMHIETIAQITKVQLNKSEYVTMSITSLLKRFKTKPPTVMAAPEFYINTKYQILQIIK